MASRKTVEEGEDASVFFLDDIADFLAREIARYRGQEIFFGLHLDTEGKAASAELLARGNGHQVPVIFDEAVRFDAVAHNHPSSFLSPSDPDLQIASVLGNHGVGFVIVNNEVSRVNVVVPPRGEVEAIPVDADELDEWVKPGGRLEKLWPGYEARESQAAMVRGVAEAFQKGRTYLVEAPTGTGKSLAYLLPSLLWAQRNRQKVVIATHTITLQEQLLDKDIPRLQAALGTELRVALVKGRNHYLCSRKFGDFESEGPLAWADDLDGPQQYEEILDWGRRTESGDRAELSFLPKGALWERLASESDTCRRSQCPCADKCFYQASRRRVFSADILVVNHHVLCADLALKKAAGNWTSQALLPAYGRLIVDEAHNLEESATSHFARQMRSTGLQRSMQLLLRQNPKKGFEISGGVLRRLEETLKARPNEGARIAFVEIGKAKSARLRYAQVAGECVGGAIEWIGRREPGGHAEKRIRVDAKLLRDPSFERDLSPHLLALAAAANQVVRPLEKALAALADEAGDEELDAMTSEAGAYARRISEAISVLEESVGSVAEGEVRWISTWKGPRGSGTLEIVAAPLFVGHSLREALFEKMKTAVLTSATLTDHRGFGFFRTRSGIAADEAPLLRIAEERHPSAFDYPRQCVGFVPADLPPPNDPDYEEALAFWVTRAARRFRGRTMALLTSYTQLTRLHAKIRSALEDEGIRILAQGDAPRQQLLASFRENRASVLLGVASFWEGVDLPGETLSCLLVTKLPFPVPSEPLHQARSEAIEAAGGDSFSEYSLPQAVLRFKQGFGRLIRTRSDRGLFIVLDRRLTEKAYGKSFAKALPEFTWHRGVDLEAAADLAMGAASP